MRGLIKKASKRKVACKGAQGEQQILVIPPSEKLVYGVKFAFTMVACLSAVEIVHIAFLGEWNSEIFAAITGLIGTVSGVLIGQRA